MRHLPLLAAPYTAPYFRRRLERYTQAVEYVYRAVQSVSGCGTIIDSSKYPAAAYPLRHMPGIDLKMIHLIRSSHGVAFSFMKKVSADGRPLMSPSRVAVEWIIYNFSFELLGALGIPSMRLRYEDFVARPPEQISHILDFLGRHRDPTELAFLGATSADLPADHSVAGNPMRLRSGREELTVDDKWRTLLPARERRIITAITAPGLLRYGYSPRHPHLLLSEP